MNSSFFTLYRIAGIVLVTALVLFHGILRAGEIDIINMREQGVISKTVSVETWSYLLTVAYDILIALLLVLLAVFYTSPAAVRYSLLLLFIVFFLPAFIWSGANCSSIAYDVAESPDTSYSGRFIYSILSPFLLFLVVSLAAVLCKRRELFYFLLLVFLTGFIGFALFAKLPHWWCGWFMLHHIL
jgi:hypothetical protein